MPVLGITSVVCLALIVERLLSLKKHKLLPSRYMTEVESLATAHKVSEALALSRATDSPVSRVVHAGLDRVSKGKDSVREAAEAAGKREISELERFLDLLSTIAAISPLVGLLGTVTGMIQTFAVVRTVGVGDPMQMSGGISEALITTAAGLVIAIPALFFHRHFLRKIDRIVLELEEFADRVFSLVIE